MRVELKNEYISIEADTLGAELTSLKKLQGDLELLWQGDENYWRGQSPILFPIVGGLPDGQYELDGSVHKMNSHGFARRSQFELVEESANKLTFRLIDNEITRGQYPFNFVFDVSYTIKDNCLVVGFSVKNTSERDMYFSLGAHPGFNCPIYDGESFDDYYLLFERAETALRRSKESGMLTGGTQEVPYDGDKLNLRHDLFTNDAIIYDALESDWIEIRSDKNDQVIRMEFEGFPYFGIWTKGSSPFICLEPWYGIDSTHGDAYDITKKEGIMLLEPGKEFNCEYKVIV